MSTHVRSSMNSRWILVFVTCDQQRLLNLLVLARNMEVDEGTD